MRDNQAGAFCAGLSGGIIILMIAIWSIAWGYEHEAVEHGAAMYHPETGEFTWIDNRSKTGTTPSPTTIEQ